MNVKIISKKAVSLFMAILMLCTVCIFAPMNAEAATKSCGYVINVYDGSSNYSGRYDCDSHSSFGNVGIFGKKVKIEFVNCYSALNREEANFYKNYARFNVYVSSNGYVKKFYQKKAGESFTIPGGKNMTVWIHSTIDSSGWDEFAKRMKKGMPWTYAQYRLKY